MASRTEELSRRAFVQKGSKAATGVMAGTLIAPRLLGRDAPARPDEMRFGLVTYLWGRDWDVPALLRNCQRAGALGVELRVDHAHGVSPALTSRERREVKLRFSNSPVELVGLGTNWAFHYEDPARVQEELKGAKEYVELSHDVGGSGVKVKPNGLPEGVPVEQTIEQIGTSLNELGQYAEEYGQEIRVEVHGSETQQLPIMKRIFDVVDRPNVGVCWNCNAEDLEGQGLEHNFNLVKDRLASAIHVREFNVGDYPYQQLFNLLTGAGYDGWVLMEARTEPADRIKALAEQRKLFDEMVAQTQTRAQHG